LSDLPLQPVKKVLPLSGRLLKIYESSRLAVQTQCCSCDGDAIELNRTLELDR
jgi:hypothetical protein